MRQLSALSDIEFESLSSGLLRATTGHVYERFGVGRDGGIDLRHVDTEDGVNEVVQCKHYIGSSFSQLLSAAGKEVPKLEALEPRPTLYRFITSQSLTKGQKAKLQDALDGWVEDPGLIWGAETIEDLLDSNPEVERNHVKLWLSSSTHLEQLLNAGTLNRSGELIERITAALPRYVQTRRFADAERMLDEVGVCLIAGEPGIGKTTLAQMLLLDCAQKGFDALYISEDVSEAWEALTETSQAFYYDDFLGRIGLQGLSKNEDRRLVELIARAQRDPRRTRIILTTREYILRGAIRLYESFERAGLERDRFLLALSDYSRHERGLVLYNHLYHSRSMEARWITQMIETKAYLEIIDHPNYNPRLIEFITGHERAQELSHIGGDWVGFAIAALNHPEAIWKRAFENELDSLQQTMLTCLITIGAAVTVEQLREAVGRQCAADGTDYSDEGFNVSLQVLELTFVRFGAKSGEPSIDVINPSISDFVMNHLVDEPRRLEAMITGASFFAQPRQLWELSQDAQPGSLGARIGDLLDSRVELLADAFIRTFESRNLERVGSYLQPAAMRADRLGAIVSACATAFLDEPRRSWLIGELERLIGMWVEGQRADGRAVSLHGALMDGPLSDLSVLTGRRVKASLEAELIDAGAYERLDELWQADPELFGIEGRSEMIGSFAGFAEAAFFEEPSSDELGRIERLAEELGVDLDESEVEEARRRATEEEEEGWEPDIETIRAMEDDHDSDEDAGDEDCELDEMFSRLTVELDPVE